MTEQERIKIEKELVTFSGQTFSNSEQVQEYIRGMLERVTQQTRDKD